MKLMQQCRAECLAAPKRIVFADALDTRVLHAANKLKKQGLADPILLGNPFELRDYAYRSGVITPCLAIVNPRHSGYFDEFAAAYQNQEQEEKNHRSAMKMPKRR